MSKKPEPVRPSKKAKGKPPLVERMNLQGRTFIASENLTFRQDARMMELTDRMGLMKLFQQAVRNPGEEVQIDLVQQLIVKAYRSGVLFDMVATGIIEEGKPKWTEEDAKATAEYISDLTDPESKQQISQCITGIIVSFFAAAKRLRLDSLLSSDASSKAATSTRGRTEVRFPAETGQG